MIDIIIPTIDAPEILKKALTSIEKTTSDLSKIHIYIINDSSKYEYEHIVNHFNNLDIKLLKTEKRIGPGPARNIGIKAGSSPYISFLDGDDTYCDDILKYCCDKYDYITTRISINIDQSKFNKIAYEYAPIEGIHGLIVSRKIIQKNNLYFPEIKYAMEDTLFRTALFLISNNRKMYKTSFYSYEDNPNSCFMHNVNPIKPGCNLLDSEYEQHCLETVWFSELYILLNNMNISNEILFSLNWNQTLVKCVLDIFNFSPWADNFLMMATIIKKFVDLNKVNLNNYTIKENFILSFIENNMSYDIKTNFLIFSPTLEFYTTYLKLLNDNITKLTDLDAFIKAYFYHYQIMLFDINSIINIQKLLYNTQKQRSNLM